MHSIPGLDDISQPAHAVVVRPEVPLSEIDRTLSALGWTRRADPYAPEPIIPDEPELAAWSHESRGETITYGFNPAISLRVLSFRSPGLVEALSLELPTLHDDDIRELLQSPRTESVLLGIAAARELDAIPLLGEISRLTSHSDATVAQAARACADQLFRSATTVGGNWVARERREHPGQSILFKYAGDARTKRQIIRWLIHDRAAAPASNASVIEVLSTALQDDDWEVQVTAMLAIGRLRVAQLRSMVDKLRLPSTGATGLSRADCHLLSAARSVVLAYLNGKFAETRLEETLTRMPGIPVNFARCVLGLPFEPMDAACLLITSLTTPVPEVADTPEELPKGIVHGVNGLELTATSIEMIWIPAVPHWLGNERDKENGAHPIGRVVPEHGYFIAKRPLTTSQIHSLTGSVPSATPLERALASYDVALQWCELLSRRSGAFVTLPTPDMWEMAARGPDGRRYPWGNNLERESFMRDPTRIRTTASPWGVLEAVGLAAQWTSPGLDTEPVLCGVPGTFHVSARAVADDKAMYVVRPVVTTS